MPEKIFCSSKRLTTSACELDKSSKLCLAKYYTNYMLSPVLFADAVNLDAVMIEISSQNILHCVLKNSLYSTVIIIPLYSHSNNDEVFLQAIGELHNAGLQPQISKLYSTGFPVSRGTPMISPLIRYVIYVYFICKHNCKYKNKISSKIIRF